MNNKTFESIDNNINNEISLKRDSFSDRICDDLCEVLLSYLSIKDKMRFECVSKQFQRCVYNKENSIEVCDSIEELGQKTIFNKLLIEIDQSFNYKIPESILKKCKFIDNICISLAFIQFNSKAANQLLNLIIKNCNNLKSIAFNFDTISDELIEKFGLKFGQQLREICFISSDLDKNINKYKKLLRLCPNLIAFSDKCLVDLSLFIDKNELLVTKLSKVNIKIESKNIALIETFVKSYKNNLKSVSFVALINDIETNVLMKQIVYLKNLTKLGLDVNFREISIKNFIENLKSIAINCNQLNSFEFHVLGTNSLLNIEIYNCLGFFKNLNYLVLSLYNFNKQSNKSNEISCKSLKDLKLLTHLKLENPLTNDIFFEDIDKHLPQLKHLDIKVDNKLITDKAMNSVSKLSKLQSIKIKSQAFMKTYVKNDDFILPLITDSGLINLINNCPQINSIYILKGRPNITHQTIDALIVLALKKPRIRFKHNFYGIENDFYDSDEDIIITAIDLNTFQLPNNLIIDKK
jgi:hypothetical protein